MPSKRSKAASQSAAAPEAASGVDTLGKTYSSISELWQEELIPVPPASAASSDTAAEPDAGRRWYGKGAAYWESQAATFDGVLGGFGHLSPLDVADSRQFLLSLPQLSTTSAIDCGAGIGRVAHHLLCPIFSYVDLVEQNPAYVDTARTLCTAPAMRHFFTSGLQSFCPAAASYSVVWVQWVLSHLTDADLVSFLTRCRQALTSRRGTYVVVKENTAREGFVMDRDDGSVTRSDLLFKAAFAQAGLQVVKQALQSGFPKGLFKVRMYALQPAPVTTTTAAQQQQQQQEGEGSEPREAEG